MYTFLFDIVVTLLGISVASVGIALSVRRFKKFALRLIVVSGTLLLVTIAVAFLKRSESEHETFLNDPVQEVQMVIVFRSPRNLDSLVDSNIRFQLKSASGRLDVRAQVFDATDSLRNPPLQLTAGPSPAWYLGVIQAPTNSAVTQHSKRLINLLSDTLRIPIELNGLQILPFRIIRDFHGMFFTPYVSEDLVSQIKECLLIANKHVLIKGEAQQAFWAPVIWTDDTITTKLRMPVASDPTILTKRPDELWQINLRE